MVESSVGGGGFISNDGIGMPNEDMSMITLTLSRKTTEQASWLISLLTRRISGQFLVRTRYLPETRMGVLHVRNSS